MCPRTSIVEKKNSCSGCMGSFPTRAGSHIFQCIESFIVFFLGRGDYIKLKHSTTLPFCGKHPGTTGKYAHTPGSSGHPLQRWRTPTELQRPAKSTFLLAKGSQDVGNAAKPRAPTQRRRIDSIESSSAIP